MSGRPDQNTDVVNSEQSELLSSQEGRIRMKNINMGKTHFEISQRQRTIRNMEIMVCEISHKM